MYQISKNFINLVKSWRSLTLLVSPLVLMPLLTINASQESRCAFVVLLMAIYWVTEPIPLPVTALLPVVLLPLLGLASTEKACAPYLTGNNMLFFGCLTLALAVEKSNLHKRIALKILHWIGTEYEWIVLGFMMTTMLLSMFIVTTATVAMMLPIADAVIIHLFGDKNSNPNESIEQMLTTSSYNKNFKRKQENATDSDILMNDNRKIKLSKLLYICISYSATIGGVSTLTANGPNMVMKFILEENVNISKEKKIALRNIINKNYEELGPLTFHELSVLTIFVLMILLYFFHDPQFTTGWAKLINTNNIKPKPASAAIFCVILLFFIPANPFSDKFSGTLLDWKTLQTKFEWGLIILRGGGFSMADAVSSSGLSKLIGQQLSLLAFLPISVIVIIISVLSTLLIEVMRTSGTATIFIPVAAKLGEDLHINPLLLVTAVTVSCAYAFITPVGTTTNAIIYYHANLKITDLLLPGMIAKTLSITMMLLNIYLLGFPIFNLSQQTPDWIHQTNYTNNFNINNAINTTVI